MNFISSMRAERSIAQFLGESNVDAPAARKAAESLKKLGGSAVPRVIDALATADKNQSKVLIETLRSQLNDSTFMQFAAGLGHSEQRCVAGVASALAVSTSYNVNKLVDLLDNDGISKPALIEVMRTKKDSLKISQLLSRAYDLQPREKAALFKIIGAAATEATVPDLLARMDGKDYAVRIHIMYILARFSRQDVAQALQEQLKDPHKSIRQAAIGALSQMEGEFNIDIERIVDLLLDPDIAVQNKTVDLLVKLRHPDTMKNLVKVLKDESEFARRSAVEVLNEIADPSSIRHLLTAIEDEDWWVRSRASDALAAIGGPKVMDAVLELIRDDNENVRRSAIEILNQTKDERAVKHLMVAISDEDWWVSERAADALGEIGDQQAVPTLLKMLNGNAQSIPAAIRALGKLGGDNVTNKILPMLEHSEKNVRLEAVNALAKLADQQQATTIKSRLQPLMSGADETIAKMAADAVVRIDNRFSTTIIKSDEIADRLTGTASTMLHEEAKPEAAAEQTQLISKPQLDITVLKPGDVIEGRYRYIDKIGKGAFGTVILVEDIVVDERLILKFLNANVSSDDEMLQRFVHELRYSRKITHKNVIRIYDFVSLGGNYAISMEYFPSHTLGAEIAREKPMPTNKAIGWSQDIATGMSVAHQIGIVHRDLKPANILIDDSGLLKVVDFGVASAASKEDTQLTKTGYVIGSPKYMAPEQILGKQVDARADIYSLGVMTYEMLTGTPPYSEGDHMAVMYQHVQGKAKLCEELNPNIPPALAAIVKKTMEVDKLKRYSSMDDLRQALADVA
jgi:HEAT repeat protein/tRNA A-37 threonylcarbamoyl transferase component Bud32